jgi:hypothetical protein
MTRDEMMQAKAEIVSKHTTRDGIIRSPGKFCGEPVWAPMLYEWSLDQSYWEKWGGGEQEDGSRPNSWYAWKVDDDMRAVFPELKDAFAVGIEETDQGFVYARELTEEEFNELEG